MAVRVALLVTMTIASIGSGAAAAADGKALYTQTCAACHASGVAGAPKLGDKDAWVSRMGAGNQALLASVLKGKGGMPARGGNASLSDADAKAAVDYMISQVK